MRKVTAINLNGRAYQLEDQGYERLQKYLHHAEATLVDDPDKAEVLADLEQALADKCDRLLRDGKNVVTAEQIADMLDQMGAVEPGTEPAASAKHADAPHTKRLYTIREGSMILGVCKGIGAYLDIDPNIIRLLFIVLTVLTGGIWIVAYIAMGLFLPAAKTESQLAAAYGDPINAQAIVDRVKERAADPEMLQQVVQLVVRLFRIAARVVAVFAALLFGIISVAWFWVLWQCVLGRFHLYDQLQMLNGWKEGLIICLLYVLLAMPVLFVFRVFDRISENRHQSRWGLISEASVLALWGVSILGLIMFATVYKQNVHDYAAAHHGKIDIGKSYVCLDPAQCTNRSPVYYHY